MKRFLSILGVVLILAVCFILPAAASSGSNFDPVYLNEHPWYMCFSPVSYTQDLVVSYSEAVQYTVQDDFEDNVLPIFPMCLDSSYKPISAGSFTVTAYRGSQLNSSSTFFEIANVPEEMYDDGRREYDLYFTFSNPEISFVALIPLQYANDQAQAAEIYTLRQSYLLSLPGYDYGYSDGIDAGKIEQYQADTLIFSQYEQQGYERGKAEWYQRGKNDAQQWTNDKDISHTILYVVSSPFIAISNFLDFTVLGINFRVIFAFVVGALIIAFVIRHFVK